MGAFTIGFLSLLLVWIIKRLSEYRHYNKIRPPYPPGPKQKPLIGNLLDFPFTSKKFREWGKEYNSQSLPFIGCRSSANRHLGTIIYAEVLGTQMIVVNKLEDAEELFESPTRARIYSDRPHIPTVPL